VIKTMRIIHVAPTPFGAPGILGGGERYLLELARALAGMVQCELLTFGTVAANAREPGGLLLRTLPARCYLHGHPAHPLAPGLFAAVRGADVVHTHQLRSTPAKMTALGAHLWHGRTAVTDHGLKSWPGLG